jgi:hypothetical protein
MLRILDDLTWAICPSFENAKWDLLRQSLIAVHPGDQPLMMDEAMKHMKDVWGCENDRKIDAWNAQLKQD